MSQSPDSSSLGRVLAATLVAVGVGVILVPSAGAQGTDEYVVPPDAVRELFDRDKHVAVLENLSPDGDHVVVPRFQELSSLELMSQRTLRLGMLELCPEVNREWRLATYGYDGLDLYSLAERRRWSVDLPAEVFVSDPVWSPSGRQLAFLAHLPGGTQVWTADPRTGAAAPLSEAYVMATLAAEAGFGGSTVSALLQWVSDEAVLTLLVPADRGPEPAAPDVPPGPIVRRSLAEATPTATRPFLLRTSHDAALFRHYTTAQLALLEPGEAPRPIAEPAMYLGFSVSPDGRSVLREHVIGSPSYLVGYTGFARDLDVVDLESGRASTIRELPLQEAADRDDRRGRDLPRDVTWRPDGAGLSFTWAAPAGDDQPADGPDRLMLLETPFDIERARTVVATDTRLGEVAYSLDGRYAFTTLSASEGEDNQEIVAFDLGTQPPTRHVLAGPIDADDVTTHPGDVMTRRDGNGIVSAITSGDGAAAYLEGDGLSPSFRPQPFIDRIAIATGSAERVWEGSSDWFERPLVPLDAEMTRLIISRESKSRVPDSYLWVAGGEPLNLTENTDPYPEITAAQRVDFDFIRRDGLRVQGRISLPVGYQPGSRVPAIFWTYPREYATPEAYANAAIRSRNHNAHTPLSFLRWSDIWLTQGYAVVYPDVPILGEDRRYNDNFVSDLTDTIYAAIRKVDQLGYVDIDRIGHGGHSYGAFATANLLAHSAFFRAGIAGDGAYNRSLTPMSFQNERRFIWDAPITYLEMSPFFYADQIDTPLLMYHGAQDNNSGTFLIQSERMMQALTGLGKTAALYIYPYESHAPRAKENLLDLWARWLDWFDTYVKRAPSPVESSAP